VVSSTLRRTIDSLELLEVEIDEKSRLFNEAAIPMLNGRFVKLKPVHWLVLFRLLSLMGIGRWASTLRKSRAEAQKAAERLSELSAEHDYIVLMGHGVTNWLIRKAMLKKGWRRESREAHGNWGCTVICFKI
jgi:broad specificity phosphatase PhoE